MGKASRTADQLKSMLMTELRKRPDCIHVLDAHVVKAYPHVSSLPNWRAQFTCNGSRSTPLGAVQLVSRMQILYDLI
jgi:hypothetical protein